LVVIGRIQRSKDDIQMQILPVIDLFNGQVVRAVAGERWRYRAISSPLTASAEPLAVARALLDLGPFAALYIADLDAITRDGSDRHRAILAAICAEAGRHGVRELWLDAGAAQWLNMLADQAREHGVSVMTVVGAESLADGDALRTLGYLPGAATWVFSIDYRAGKFLGPAGLDASVAQWPSRVIVMELSAVGVGGGPALACLDLLVAAAHSAGRTDIAFFAGGGVRDTADLRTLASHGAAGALVASALHDGHLDAATLREFTPQ
jgi:phosphoribosylformimino-5-aminoimidazole carboxamide ribotide isomerase